MSLQDNSILSIPCYMGLALFKSFALGMALFFSFSFVFWFFFFPAVIGCQHDLHLLKIRNGKKKKNQKAKRDLKANSSEVHSYLLAVTRRSLKAESAGIVERLARLPTRRHAPRNYTARSTALWGGTARRNTTCFIHLYFPLFWSLLRTEHLWAILT